VSEADPGRILFGPVMHAAREGRGWELVSVDLEQGPVVTVRHGDRLLALELGPRDEAAPCYARTERFNVYTRRLLHGEGRPFDDADRTAADEVLHALREGERGLPRFDRPATTTRAAVREIRVERALVPEGAGQYSLNPYVGCMIAFRPGRGIVLTGGEPTIRKDLVRLVAAAHTIGYGPIQVQTNGRMLSYPNVLAALLAAGVTEVSPALHGPTAEVHDALTRAPGSFEQTLGGIRNAVDAGVTVVTNTVVQRGNLDVLVQTLEVLAGAGVRHAQMAMVHPVGTAAERFDEVVPRLDEAAPRVRRTFEAGRYLGLRVVVEAMPPCFLRGLEDAVVEDSIPETTVVDLDGEPMAFSEWRRGEGKAKGPPCTRCSRADRCEGPWREYPDAHGWRGYDPFGPL